MSFSFGAQKPDGNTPGFSFGTAANAGAGDAKGGTAKPFGLGTPTTSSTGFILGGFGAQTTVAGGFGANSLNLTATTSSAPVSTSVNFGSTPVTTGISLGSAASTTPSGLGFGIPGTQSTGFKLNSTTTATPTLNLAPTSTLNLTSSPAANSTSFGFLSTPKTTTATPASTGFTLSSTTIAPASTAATTTTASFSFGGTTTVSTAGTTALGFSTISGTKPTTSSTGFSLTAPAVSTATTTTSVLPTTGNLTFGQLVDAINKWTIDLEEQGKLFSNQAKQLNAWDRLLVSNGEKVLSLNSGIERVKQQQQQLDQELDFVLAQQKELEDLITPLEKEINDIPLTDVDRIHTYQVAENMDTQLKQMSEDLKEIIEQLNESNKSLENSNPITQIRKILNAHMDSLQWIDRHTAKITSHLDQISKMHDFHRKSHEHSLKKTYD